MMLENGQQSSIKRAGKGGVVRGVAPWQLALRRLAKHRLAMLGLILEIGILILIFWGDKAVPTSAEEIRLWIGASPPGFAHPDCPEEIRLVEGERARLGRRAERCEKLFYRTQTKRRREIRVSLRRGRINMITEGPDALDSFASADVNAEVYEVLEDGTLGRQLPEVNLAVGNEPPPGLLGEGQRVLFLGWEEKGDEALVGVTLDESTIVDIRIADGPDSQPRKVGQAALRGEDVLAVLGDGRPLVLRHPLGTDELGRDLFLRIVSGGRVSLLVAAVASFVSLVVGVSYGAMSGFIGGRTDSVMMRLVDILYGLPFIFLVLLLMVVFDRNIILLFAALGLVQWLTMARIVRGQVLSLRHQEFVEAARMSGASSPRILAFHLLPHLLGPVVVYTTLTIPLVILEESFLAFIGLPVQYQGTTLDSWGSLVHLGMSALGEQGQKWWLLVFPSLAMVVTLFGLNCLGDGLRDSIDPKG